MLSTTSLLAFALALALPASTAPAPVPLTFKRASGQCTGQSCDIAALSGSSGQPYEHVYKFDAGICCVLTYNPSASAVIFAEKPGLTCPATKRERDATALDAELQAQVVKQAPAAACAPYTLVYARGTGEPGTLGITVGPALSADLLLIAPGKWSIQGVAYDATVDGDNCLGLPGGAIASQLINQIASSCPSTKIVVSGYSEGGMVAHNGVAGASASARAKVVAVVPFGDPFNGAPIKGFSGPIQTYCADADGVCGGTFTVSAAHLSYVGVDTTEAALYISGVVR